MESRGVAYTKAILRTSSSLALKVLHNSGAWQTALGSVWSRKSTKIHNSNAQRELKQRGFKLITLQEAESDPEYVHDPDLPSRWDGTFLQQMMVAKHMTEPALPVTGAACL